MGPGPYFENDYTGYSVNSCWIKQVLTWKIYKRNVETSSGLGRDITCTCLVGPLSLKQLLMMSYYDSNLGGWGGSIIKKNYHKNSFPWKKVKVQAINQQNFEHICVRVKGMHAIFKSLAGWEEGIFCLFWWNYKPPRLGLCFSFFSSNTAVTKHPWLLSTLKVANQTEMRCK